MLRKTIATSSQSATVIQAIIRGFLFRTTDVRAFRINAKKTYYVKQTKLKREKDRYNNEIYKLHLKVLFLGNHEKLEATLKATQIQAVICSFIARKSDARI